MKKSNEPRRTQSSTKEKSPQSNATSKHTTTQARKSQTENGHAESSEPAQDQSASRLEISQASQAYEEITKWRRSLFKLPKGNTGKQYVCIMTKLIGEWTSTNDVEKLKLLMSMPNLLLQRTSKKGKARENKDNLSRRLELWENGKYEELVKSHNFR